MESNEIEKEFLIVRALVEVIPFVDRKLKHVIECLMLKAPRDEHQQNHRCARHERCTAKANKILLTGIPQERRCVPWHTTDKQNSNLIHAIFQRTLLNVSTH